MLDNGFNYVCKQLNSKGFKAYAVGGVVRDNLLGKKCQDIDITTNAMPQEIIDTFPKERKILTGLKHGTVGVVVNHVVYEVTTFRQDGNYLDNRHPESVSFIKTIDGDLARRDFTINAIAYNQEEGYVDLFGGIQDLENKIIKCVGNPDERFKEDALRILRAMRFSSQLSFKIEQGTKQAILNNKHLLKNISVERILVELKKLLLGDNVVSVMLEYKDVIAEIIPEIKPTFNFDQKSIYHRYDVYEHTVRAIAHSEKDELIRLVLLLHDIAKPQCFVLDKKGRGHCPGHPKVSADIAFNVLKRLRVDKDTLFTSLKLIENHDNFIREDKVAVKELLRQLGEKNFLLLLKVQKADALAHTIKTSNQRRKHLNILRELFREIKRNKECFNLKYLAVNGTDIKALGYSGKQVGEILSKLLTLVINGQENNKEQLLKLI